MKKMIAIIGIVCLCSGLAFADGPAIDFDGRNGGNRIETGMLRNIQIEVPPAADFSADAVEPVME